MCQEFVIRLQGPGGVRPCPEMQVGSLMPSCLGEMGSSRKQGETQVYAQKGESMAKSARDTHHPSSTA